MSENVSIWWQGRFTKTDISSRQDAIHAAAYTISSRVTSNLLDILPSSMSGITFSQNHRKTTINDLQFCFIFGAMIFNIWYVPFFAITKQYTFKHNCLISSNLKILQLLQKRMCPRHSWKIFPVNPRREQHRNLPNSLETGDTAAFSPILDSASKYNFPAMDIAGKMIKCLWEVSVVVEDQMFYIFLNFVCLSNLWLPITVAESTVGEKNNSPLKDFS